MKKLFLTLFFIFSFASSTFAITYNEIALQNKPVVILFKADYCHVCKEFEPVFDYVARKDSNKFVFVKEDANSSSLARQLGIEYVPVVFIINPNTMNAYKIEYGGFYLTPKSFEDAINKYNPDRN